MKYYCIVLFLVLLLRTSSQTSTLFVDTIEYNYATTEVPTFVSTNSSVVLAEAVTFNLQPAGGIAINTVGPVQLTGSFVQINSDGSITQTAGGNLNLDASDSLSILTSNLNLTAENNFTMTTVANNLEVNVGNSVLAIVDTAYIVGQGTVSINSGGGAVEFFSDESVVLSGLNTNVLGENRVTFEALYDMSIDATDSFQSRSTLLDFDVLGDIRITSNNNAQFTAGSEFILEAQNIYIDAVEGVDVTSLHGDVFVNSANNLFLASQGTVNFQINNDANFISENGPVSFKAQQFSATAPITIDLFATSLDSQSTTFDVTTVVTNIDTQASIQFTYTGSSANNAVFNANENLQIHSNFFNSSSASLQISTQSLVGSTNNVIFQSNSIDNSVLSFSSAGDTDVYAIGTIYLLAGSVDNSADTFSLHANLNLNVYAQYKSFDFLYYNAPVITLEGLNQVIDGNIAELQSGKNINLSVAGSLTLDSSYTDGGSQFQSQGPFVINVDLQSVFSSTLDSTWSAYTIDAYLDKSFSSSSFLDTKLFSDSSTFVALNGIHATAYYIDLIGLNQFVLGSNIYYSADNFNVWANEYANIFAFGDQNYNFIEGLTFKAFDSLSISDLVSVNATQTLAFQANENIQIFADNFGFSAGSIDLATSTRSDLTWIGNSFSSSAANTYFDSPVGSYQSVNNLTFTAPSINISSTLQRQIYFETLGNDNFTLANGSNFVNSAGDLFFDAQFGTILNSTHGSITFESPNEVYESTGNYFANGRDLVITSNHNVNLVASEVFEIITSGNIAVDINRNATFNAEEVAFVFSGGTTTYQSNEWTLNQISSPAYYNLQPIILTARGNFDISLTGDFRQNGGSVSFTTLGSQAISSAQVLSFNSIDSSEITLENGNLTFNSLPVNSSIVFESRDYVVNAASTIDFLGGNITLTSNQTQNIIFNSNYNITINTNNNKAFTWTSRDDINTTVGNFTVRANKVNAQGNSISFITTSDEGNFVANVRSGWLNLQSLDSQTYSANFIELYAANDITFNTSLKLSPNTGGITFTTQGFLHNPVFGEKTGISFQTLGNPTNIYLDAPKGAQSFQAGYDLTVDSTEGFIDVLANQDIYFTTTAGSLLINSADQLSFVTDTGNITFQTSTGNTEVRASSNVGYVAGTNIYLTSTDPISRTNGRAFDFSATAGNINVLANSQNDVNWVVGGEIYTKSAQITTQFGEEGIFYTAVTGQYLAQSNTGIKLIVQNGDLNLNASQNVFFSSATNWPILVASGQNSLWTAQSKDIEVTAGVNTTIRTQRGNIGFHTDEGNIFIDGTGQIRFQADGTLSTPNGVATDGIFVIAPNVAVYAEDSATIESEALVTIGHQTTPVVKFVAGGSAGSLGTGFTSVGNAHFTISNNVNIQSGGNLFMAALNEFDLKSTGSISISTTGTDPSGKDFVVRTDSELDLTAQSAYYNGQDAVNIISFQSITFTSTGTDPVTSNIQLNSAEDFQFVVDSHMNVNAADWTTVASAQFSIEIESDLLFTNLFPSTSGQIYIYGDESLDFSANTFITVETTGANSNITLKTLGPNSDILVQTFEDTSSINLHTLGNLVSTSINDLEFQTVAKIIFESDDNIDDGVQNGAINIFTPDDISTLSYTLTLQGDEGATFTSVNRADIILRSAGGFVIQSDDKMLFDTVNGKLSISANLALNFDTFLGRDGDIAITTTRDLLITSTSQATFTYGGDFSVIAQTIDYSSLAGTHLSLITVGQGSTFNLFSDVITLTGGMTSTLQGGIVNLESTGPAYLTSATSTAISTIANHGHITYSSAQQLIISATGLSIESFAQAGYYDTGYYNQIPANYDDFYSHRGHGFLNFTSYGSNPQFGYGLLLNATNNIAIQSTANVNFVAYEGTVNLKVGGSLTFNTQNDIAHDKSIRISALGTDSKLLMNSTLDFQFNSANRNVFFAQSAIQFLAYDLITFTSNGDSVIDTEVALQVLSTHPHGDINMYTTHFDDSVIDFNANGFEIYGERGLEFYLQDDDDTDAASAIQFTANFVSLEAENAGLVQTTGGGDIIINAVSYVHIHAGDDLFVEAAQQFQILAATWQIETPTPLQFASQQSSVNQGSNSFTTYNVKGDAFIFSGTNTITANQQIVFQEGTLAPVTSPQQFSVIGTKNIVFTANNFHITTQRQRSVDFLDGLKLPAFNNFPNQRDVTTGAGCATQGELFLDFSYNQFCYCRRSTQTLLCTQTLIAYFNY